MATPAEVAQIIAHNRLAKAQKLADALQAKNFTLAEVRGLTVHGWHIVAACAGVKVPSSDTVEIVIDLYETRLAQPRQI